MTLKHEIQIQIAGEKEREREREKHSTQIKKASHTNTFHPVLVRIVPTGSTVSTRILFIE